jgi:AsmA protein
LVAFIAVGLGVLVAMPPVELVRSHIAAEVERQTGRKVTISEAGVSFASGLGVSLSGVTLSASPAAGGGPLLAVERMEVTLALLPLIAREVRIDRLTLVRPVLELRIDATGRRSWDFAGLAGGTAPRPLRYAQAGGRMTDADRLPPELKEFARNASPPGAGRRNLEALSLTDVRIVDGRVRYEDARSGLARDLRGIDATLSLPSLAGALSLKGELTLAGERLNLEARLDQLQELIAERPVASRIKLEGSSFGASYDGKLAGLVQPVGEGRLQIKAPSATALARLLELPLAGLEPIGAVSLDGQIRVSANGVTLSSASFAAGDTSGTGTIGFESAERPRMVANLRFAALDADQLSGIAIAARPAQPASDMVGSAGRFAVPGARLPEAAAPKSIDDLIGREQAAPSTSPATRVHGFRMRAGNQWDIEAFDTAALRLADADARVQIAALKAGGLQAANVQTGVELKAGLLRISVTDGQVAGGSVRGLVSIDARQPALTVGANLSGDNVALKPLLEAAGVNPIEGKGRVIIAVSAQGASERDLVSTLAGRAEVKVVDGALLGWDADAIVNDLAHGKMPPAHRQPGARTPFKELSATFQLAQGVARTRDLKLESPSLQSGGLGTVNIVDRNIDLVLKARVATGGLEVPVRIAGNWDDPTVVADVAGALKSPQAHEAARQLKEGNVEGALRSVLGNGPKADEKIGKAKEVLKGLLGGSR